MSHIARAGEMHSINCELGKAASISLFFALLAVDVLIMERHDINNA